MSDSVKILFPALNPGNQLQDVVFDAILYLWFIQLRRSHGDGGGMTLNSVVFIFAFLPAVLVIFYATSLVRAGVLKRVVLLAASLFFYSWIAREYLVFLLAIVMLNYAVAVFIDTSKGRNRKAAVAFAVVVDVFALVYYKYFGFLGEQLDALLGFGFTNVDIIQPLGVSFLTFSLISYIVDVYRRDIAADRNVLNVVLWACFFPKITSGPISRYAEMKFESWQCIRFDFECFAYGVRRFVIGLAKKVVIADSLGVVVDSIFSAQQTGIDTPTAWLGIVCYSFQIFFDFAGYSDMAIGLAAMFGFRLKENFLYPYVSTTLGEFWRRWHISLSSWLRDYIYFPLGGSRRGNVYVNLMIVFLVSGFWHGADWHYIAWGAWYAVFMVIDRIYRKKWAKLGIPKPLLWLFTMVIVVLGWVFFRSDGMTQAASYLMLLFGVGSVDGQFLGFWYYFNPQLVFLLVIAALCSTPLFAKMREMYGDGTTWGVLRLVGIPCLFVIAVIYMVNSSYSPFLYAQF